MGGNHAKGKKNAMYCLLGVVNIRNFLPYSISSRVVVAIVKLPDHTSSVIFAVNIPTNVYALLAYYITFPSEYTYCYSYSYI